MAAVTEIVGIEHQLAEALTQVRNARHGEGCTCWHGKIRRPLFCSLQESSWSHILNCLLDRAVYEYRCSVARQRINELNTILKED